MAGELGPKGHIHAAAPTRPGTEAPGRTPPPPTSRPDVSTPSRGRGISRRGLLLGLAGAGGMALAGKLALDRVGSSGATPTPPRRDGGGAAVTTPTSEAPRSEIQRQIGVLSRQIESSHAITLPDLQAWGAQNPITSGFASGYEFDFPILEDATVLRTDDPAHPEPYLLTYRDHTARDSIDRTGSVVGEFTPSVGPLFVDSRMNTEGFPGEPVPQDFYLFDTLVRYDGNITVPIAGRDGASATISFGTMLWGDGQKTTIAFTSNVTDPSDSRLNGNGEAAFIGSFPLIGRSTKRGNVNTMTSDRILNIRDERESLSPEELIDDLDEAVGSPLELDFRGNGFGNHLSYLGYEFDHLAATNPFSSDQFAALNAMVNGFVYQQPDVFALGEAAGQNLGFIIDPSDIDGSIQGLIDRVAASGGLDGILNVTPFAQPYLIEGLQKIGE